MERTLNLNTTIQLTFNQVVELVKQLPSNERVKLATMIIDEGETMTKEELKSKITEGLQDVKLHKEGKIKLRTLTEFLADV